MLAVGVAAAAALGGFALSSRGAPAGSRPLPSWGVFNETEWATVGQRAATLGFASATMQVVAATPKQDGTPFALVGATSTAGRTCFIPVRGISLGQPICRLTKPLVIFTIPDRVPSGTGATVPAMDIIGLARHDVTSLIADSISNGRQFEQGEPLLPAAGAWAFGSRYQGISQFVARNGAGRVVATTSVTALSP